MKILPECFYDFCLLDFPEWTEKEEKEANKIKELTELFKNPKFGEFHEDEYPVQ